MFFQKTIRKSIQVEGVGIHSGKLTTLRFKPAPANTGVYFIRADLPNRPFLKVSALNVQAVSYQTTLGGPFFQVATIEHCVSALSALRLDNIYIELDGPEIPICDGSALQFLEALVLAEIIELDEPRKYCYITEPISYNEGEKSAYILPYHGLHLTVTIDFPHPQIGLQKLDLEINEQTFSRDIARARTFGFLKDVEALKAAGLALGGSLDNCIVLDENRIVNPEGLRFPDEFVRHKVLDALGDLVTLEMPLMGHVVLHKAGHDIMNKLIKKIVASPGSYRFVELGADISAETKKFANWTLNT
ncbi:MAG: UDP-3-O-[3-hydroxymyristoyl] N-acetylglucosamine deacetylase [Bdellovibrionales bacterium RIFCSPHIGHO2_01_FULL_40_29]|nr:MAG: UDP-3-O-[3-hydroxymyristoyl] N-acetylglucosamine deacetylase [Bdellovibrionales bacterium RIFCSPHIGHO2_01_FULL_40_29]OFZ32691.1 MAG: UDP-3-O-[3-hydroxymyristoyl] N-acetylglucosamine deacetylase [Bdellovibrionales bacterium RIFCSPHIGHO2_02_FULL_40_15]